MADLKFKYQDDAGLLYTITEIVKRINERVKKEDGKALTSNDFTDELKAKLDAIAEGATKVIVDAVLNKESDNAVSNKAAATEFEKKANLSSPIFTGVPMAPTAEEGTVSQQIATTSFVSTAIAKALAGFTGISFEKVDTLPATGKAGTIYLVPLSTTSETNIYEEYFWFENRFEYMGTTAVDLSNYVQQTDLIAITETEIDAMFAAQPS